MSIDPKRYPANWKQISLARREQAGQKCEWCGVPNHAWIIRKRGTSDYLIMIMDDMFGCSGYRDMDGEEFHLHTLPEFIEEYDYKKPTLVILTVAHLGTPHPDGRPGDKHDKMDVRPENLAALCQACHLNFDRDEHKENSKKTRLRKRQQKIAATGQRALFGEGVS
jgi:hypothetical protein